MTAVGGCTDALLRTASQHKQTSQAGSVCSPTRECFEGMAVGARRLSLYQLAVRGSNMPCAAGRVSLGPDNLDFRRRLRRAHPATEAAMRKQREDCLQVRSV